MNNIILTVDKLTKFYGSLKAVDNLSFEVEKGSVFGFLGPNGSGKSTTLGIITHVINSTSGDYSWFGKPSIEKTSHRLGALLERPNFYGYMNAVDNLKIVAEIRNVDQSDISETLKIVKLYDRRKSRFSTYSFGMQQRLAIASALLGGPEVLILDEPTNGLDPEGIVEIRNMISDIAHSGKTIILASHLLDEVQKVCTDLIILKNGHKIYSGKISGLDLSSNLLEMKSLDINLLKDVAATHPKILSVSFVDGYVLATIEPDVDPSEINSYLLEYGVSLSHLSIKKHSLESQFLELLKS